MLVQTKLCNYNSAQLTVDMRRYFTINQVYVVIIINILNLFFAGYIAPLTLHHKKMANNRSSNSFAVKKLLVSLS